jgi:FlaA1/EpsC-like NDP-sugar epimerase/lipopolysaccharide/colanic/teichoic acid biosynthesis glycosyltransferase
MKRLMDIALSTFGLIICLPIFIIAGFLIKIDSPGPVFFRQKRVGRDGKTFKIFKFRTMVIDAERLGPPITRKNDLRITPVGNLLRWLKVDELPQLINVLNGEMSLIGPRPEIPGIVAGYSKEDREVLLVRPGIVGPSQILLRNEVSKYPEKMVDPLEYYNQVILPEKLAIDRQYVKVAGFWSDMSYLFRGLAATIFGSIQSSVFINSKPRFKLIAVDTLCITFSYFLATAFRFDFRISSQQLNFCCKVLPVIVPITIIFLLYLGVYSRLWTYFDKRNLVSLVKAILYSTVFLNFVFFMMDLRNHPRSIMLIYIPLVINFLILSRYIIRSVTGDRTVAVKSKGLKRAIIAGIGDNTAGVIYHLLHDRSLKREIVGFVGNDARYQGMTLEGIKVLGKIYDIPQIVSFMNVSEVLVIQSNVDSLELRTIRDFCRKADVKIQLIPTIGDLINGKVHVSKSRDLNITDLLGRKQVKLDLSEVKRLIRNKPVMVSGAGGSIGSELCRQVAQFEPSNLILIDKAENYLHDIILELHTMYPHLRITDFNTSITNQRKLKYIFSTHTPEIVFHAAAHKHVPLSESNPDEAVINNVFATKIFAETASQFGVGTFVMVSSDKAVNPNNIMGATKRIAELFLKQLAERSSTRFIIIRFGNVLGSNGSVVKIFQRQIEMGGPLTITDPRMTRYFMTIPEACQLVIQGTTIGESGQILMLDMGTPIKIVDLAKEMIKIYGLVPGRDIQIKYSGIRPGEKLFEELSYSEEDVIRTKHEKIFILKSKSNGIDNIEQKIKNLYQKAFYFDQDGIREDIRTLIPDFPLKGDAYKNVGSEAVSSS